MAVLPPKGAVDGDIPIQIFGSGFSPRASALGVMLCKFGNLTSAATLDESGNAVNCTLPRGPAGFVSVEVSNNLFDFSGSNLKFEYVELNIDATEPSDGPTAGGTVLTITGTGFQPSATHGLWCQFGPALVAPAAWQSTSAVVCVTPAVADAQTVALALQIGGVDSRNTIPYHFLSSIIVVSAHPLIGPTTGGTLVTVEGLHFTATSWCRFGDTAVVPAVFISSERVQCITPNHAVGHADVRVSSNRLDFYGVVNLFEYLDVAQVQSVYPAAGPVAGGTLVTLRGDFFEERAASLYYLQCRFNITVVPAIFVSPTEVTCYSPEMSTGCAPLKQSVGSR